MSTFPERIRPDQTMAVDYLDHVARYAYVKPHVGGAIVLDCGCGNGYGSRELAAVAQYVDAVDVSSDAIAYARQHYRARNLGFAQMDASRLQFPDARFNAVCCFEVIEHVRDWALCLQEIARVMRPGGTLFLSTPNRHVVSPGSAVPLNPYHIHEFEAEELAAALRARFGSVELLGEFEDARLQQIHIALAQSRHGLYAVDRLGLRRLVPRWIRRAVVSALVRRRTGLDPRSVTQASIRFAASGVSAAPTFFAIATK